MEYYKDINTVEDQPLKPSIFSALITMLFQCIASLLWIPLSIVCVPLYLPGLIIWGRPPTIPSWSRFYRYFTATWTEGKSEDSIPLANRILVFQIILDVIIKSPINGVCWFLDELLYPSYHNTDIKDPVFIISAMRSGSTQLIEYIGEDKDNFIVPMVIEGLFPYIWVWRLVLPSCKILGIDRHMEARFLSGSSEEIRKRHNIDLYKSDTWEVILGSGHLLTFLCQYLGCSFFKWGFVFSALKNHPVDKQLCKCFVDVNDCIMKKVMYHRGLPMQRLVIKGHCLFAAKYLEKNYQGSKFITTVRDPIARIQSLVNYTKVKASNAAPRRLLGLFPLTWRVARDWTVETAISYCEEEMLFYNQSEENTKNKLAISFTSYVNNLTGTLQNIYSFLNIPLPVEVLSKAFSLQSSTHNRAKRKSTYDPKYNRSLSSLYVDEDKLREHLTDYINWMKELYDKNY